MSSILKVDTIQDQAGNNIINENSNTITIGASGDTINIIGTLQNNGGALPGDISSVVAGTGLSGGGTSGAVTINIEAAQPTITSLGTITSFRSTGIDDNATSTAMTINSGENIGINTTSPDAMLHIMKSDAGALLDSDADDFFIENNGNTGLTIGSSTSGDGNIRFSDSGDADVGEIKYNHSDNSLRFRANASERVRITSAGLVGIGTSNPSHNLTVDGGTSTSVSLIKDETGSATVRYYNGGSQKAYIQLTSSEDMDFYAASGVDQVFYGQGVERMRLNGGAVFNEGSVDADFRVESNGNANMLYVDGGNNRVGIGTSTPARTLSVFDTTPIVALYNSTTGTANNDGFQLQLSSDDGYLWNYESGGHTIFGTAGTERMRIPNGGGLLVGKTSSNIATAGFEISSGGDFSATKSGSTIAQFNRLTNDGDVVRIKKDGTTKHVFTTTSLGVGVSSTATTLTVGSTASGNQGVTGKTALFSGTHTTVYNAGNNGTFGGITIVNGDSTSNRTAAGVNFVNGNSGVSSIVGTSDTASRGDLRFITRGADNSGNTSERMRIADNGSVLIGTSTSGSAVAGDLVVNGGVFLGGTATANELDDYEEGTWTPAYRGASSAGSYSSNANGTYTKIGNKVFVTAHIKNITQNSAGSGSIQIAGLPFAKTNSQESDIGSIYLNLFSLGSSHEYAIVNVNPGLSTVLITAIDSDGGAASTLQLSARQSDSADMFFSVTYTT